MNFGLNNKDASTGFLHNHTRNPWRHLAGFTLVELLVGASLALIVMIAVLSAYTSLTRSFTRTLGLTSTSGPTMEAQSRRAISYFIQDVRMSSTASVTSTTAPSFNITFSSPAGVYTRSVTYYYNGTSSAATPSISGTNVNVPAYSVVRVVSNGSAVIAPVVTVITNIVATNEGCYIRFYDSSGKAYDNGSAPYTTVTTYFSGIKAASLSFSTQAGSSANGSLTQIYPSASPRVLLRNKALLQ